jgi:23S rRNA (adenine-N6)-dimethyltransferase
VAGHPSTRRARRHSLGQHFLESEALVARLLADAEVAPDDTVVDLGAGRGALTAALARRAGSVIAVELDPDLVTTLAARFRSGQNVVVLQADARDVALPRTPYRVLANPPWSCTADVLHRLLDDVDGGLARADLVLQWQVARARVAGDDMLGAIWSPWWCFARGRRIPAALFRPAPSVDAGVLVITRREPPRLPVTEFAQYAEFVRSKWGRDGSAVPTTRWAEQYRRGP